MPGSSKQKRWSKTRRRWSFTHDKPKKAADESSGANSPLHAVKDSATADAGGESEEAAVGMDEDWWSSDNVSREQEAASVGVSKMNSPLDASVFGLAPPEKATGGTSGAEEQQSQEQAAQDAQAR